MTPLHDHPELAAIIAVAATKRDGEQAFTRKQSWVIAVSLIAFSVGMLALLAFSH